jgi:hypothetical protein
MIVNERENPRITVHPEKKKKKKKTPDLEPGRKKMCI